MKFSTPHFLYSVFAASAALASSSLLPANAIEQPPLSYPIGTSNGTNAKVSGRLFEIDGKVEYFAGLFDRRYWLQSLSL
jgi:mannan endo-1,4-beta-mannosidase